MSFELFHGTTRPAADQILEEGWKALDVEESIASFAERHELDPEVVKADLVAYARFVSQAGRGQFVSFCCDPLKAEHQWAQRAPEAHWEILWAIWRVKNGVTAPEPWNLLMEGHAWVWEQMKATPVAVVAVTVTRAELKRIGAMEGGFGLRRLSEHFRPDLTVELAVPLPYRPPRNRLMVREVPRHVDWELFAHLLAMPAEKFIEADRRGLFGPCASEAVPVDRLGPMTVRPWWTQDAVEAYLANRTAIWRER